MRQNAKKNYGRLVQTKRWMMIWIQYLEGLEAGVLRGFATGLGGSDGGGFCTSRNIFTIFLTSELFPVILIEFLDGFSLVTHFDPCEFKM